MSMVELWATFQVVGNVLCCLGIAILILYFLIIYIYLHKR